MDNFSFEELQRRRVANLQSQFTNAEELQKGEDDEMEKARHGTYADTAQNRRLNRVGQEYGHKAKEKQPSGQSTKKTEEVSGKGGKTVADHAADTDSEVLQKVVDDPKAKPELKEAAQAELKKRGEVGEDNTEKESSEENEKNRKNDSQEVEEDEEVKEYYEGANENQRKILKREAKIAKSSVINYAQGSKELDWFMNDNKKYFQDVLERYHAEDVDDLMIRAEEMESNGKDGYGWYDKVYIKCMKKIPAEKYVRFQQETYGY